MRDAVRAHPVARRYLDDAEAVEEAITWEHDSGLKCKGMLDIITPSSVVDVKTTRNPGAWAFGRDAAKYGYHAQLSFYRDGLVLARREPQRRSVIIAVENVPPYDVVVYHLPEPVLEAGRELCEDLIADLLGCQMTNKWPGRADTIQELELPAYAMGTEAEPVTIGGEPLPL
jgi:hypothetical protein